MLNYVIGFDCGGSNTVAAAVGADGGVLAQKSGGGSNFLSVGMDEAIRVIRDLYCALDALTNGKCLALSFASSALDERQAKQDPALIEFLTALQTDPVLGAVGRFFIKSDAYMALYGLCGEESGALLIAGTGMMGLARRGDRTLKTVGGWGDKLDDAGSGFWIAKQGVLTALEYADTLDPDGKALYEAFLDFYQLNDAGEFTEKLYAPDFTKDRLAAFSACVSKLSERDHRARAILLQAAAQLHRYACVLYRFVDDPAAPFGVYGSVLTKDAVVAGEFSRLMKTAFPDLQIQVPAAKCEVASALYAWRNLK